MKCVHFYKALIFNEIIQDVGLAPLPSLLCPKQGLFTNSAKFWRQENRGQANRKAAS